MRTDPRPRRYVTVPKLAMMRPLLRYSEGRGAYVLRLAGNRAGPVLRPELRRPRGGVYFGPERRQSESRFERGFLQSPPSDSNRKPLHHKRAAARPKRRSY
jgi:hypothetical protein